MDRILRDEELETSAILSTVNITIDSRFIKQFKAVKFIYYNVIILFLAFGLLFDNTKYTTDIWEISYFYLMAEVISVCVFALKNGCCSRTRIASSIVSTIMRFFIILLSIYGIVELVNEKDTDGYTYILMWYIFVSNLFFVLVSILLIIIVMIYYKTLSIKKKRTTLSVVDDVSDIYVFSTLLNNIGTTIYHDTSCVICFENFQSDDKIKLLPCNHYFHDACISKWISTNETCPICRGSSSLSV